MGPARSRRWRWVSAQAWLGPDAAAAFLGCSWGPGYYFSRIKVFRGGRDGAGQEKGPLSVLTIPLDRKVHAHRLQSSRKAENLCQQGAEVTRRPRDLRSPRPSRIFLCSPSVFLLQARQTRPQKAAPVRGSANGAPRGCGRLPCLGARSRRLRKTELGAVAPLPPLEPDRSPPTRGLSSSGTCSACFSGTDLPGLFAAPARVPRPCWASGASLPWRGLLRRHLESSL